MEEVQGQVAVRMALSGPLNDKRVGSIGSKHSERTRRFSRLRLDVAVSATGWSEPVLGRGSRPLTVQRPFPGALFQQLS
jgi:hypothetical protein